MNTSNLSTATVEVTMARDAVSVSSARGQIEESRVAARADSRAAVADGPAAAAILSAGIGCFAVGLFATLGDAFPAVNRFFTFYKPTGGLSGVTTLAIAIWLIGWFALANLWGNKNVAMARVNIVSFVLLTLGVLLTFPPFMDFLQGK